MIAWVRGVDERERRACGDLSPTCLLLGGRQIGFWLRISQIGLAVRRIAREYGSRDGVQNENLGCTEGVDVPDIDDDRTFLPKL